MTQKEMLDQLKRLGSITPKAWDDGDVAQRKALIDELHRKFFSVHPLRWKEIVTQVIDTHKGHAMPTVFEFTEAHKAIQKKLGGPKDFEAACHVCNGVGLVYGNFIHVRSGEACTAMKACPVCRPNVPNSPVYKEVLEHSSNVDQAQRAAGEREET